MKAKFMRLLIAVLLAFACVRGSAFADVTFDVVTGDVTGIPPVLTTWKNANPYYWIWSIKEYDFNFDGKPDLVCTVHGAEGSKFFKNNGDGTFTDVTATLAPNIPARDTPHEFRPVVMDVNNDGKLDLIGSTQGKLPILLNNGTILVKGQLVQDLGEKTGYVTDVNGDGWQDFKQYQSDYGVTTHSTFTNTANPALPGLTKTTVEEPYPPGLPPDVVAKLNGLRGVGAGVGNHQNRYSGPVFWKADLNGDGVEDNIIRYAGSYNASPGSAYRWGWFATDTGIAANVIPLAVKDVTGDGRADVFCGYGAGAGLWVQGDAGVFTLAVNTELNNALKETTLVYLPEFQFHDLDQDGDQDLVLNGRRARWTDVYDNRGGGVFVRVFRANSWDAQGFGVADFNGDGKLDVAIGGPGPNPFVNSSDVQKNTKVTMYYNTSVLPVISLLKHPLEKADPATKESKRFLTWVDTAIAGSQHGFSAYHAAVAHKITGDDKYAVKAAEMVNAEVTAAKANAAAGQVPKIGSDSYLDAFPMMQGATYSMTWCRNKFTKDELKAIEEYCEQAVFNIWNPTIATWYGKPFRWTGWAVNNPGNNYHYSFLGATVCWALCSNSGKWLDLLKTERLPKLVSYMRQLPEGGSREGTGYGISHKALFDVYTIWLASTGEDLAAKTDHCRRSIDYWRHATTPDGKVVAPIGDQARDSTAPVYDYQRQLMIYAVNLNNGTDEEKRGREWLTSVYPVMRHGFNTVHDILRPEPILEVPSDGKSYSANGVGHYFARSGPGTEASFVVARGGPFFEGHAHQDQGGYDFWHRGWLTSTETVRTRSGIKQTTDYQNIIRFEKDGKLVPQVRGAAPVCTVTDDGNVWEYRCDLGMMYGAANIAWKRSVKYTRPAKLRIADDVEVSPETTAVWQMQVPTEPRLCECKHGIISGRLVAHVREPENPLVKFESWRLLDPVNSPDGGWRVEIRGGNKFDVTCEMTQ